MLFLDLSLFLLVMLVTVNRMRARAQSLKQIIFYVGISIVILIFSRFACNMLLLLSRVTPYVYDPILCRIETLTGLVQNGPVSFFLKMDQYVGLLILMIYDSLPVLVLIAASSEIIFAPWSFRDNLLTRFIITALLGFSLYPLMPAVGPFAFFGPGFIRYMPPPNTTPAHTVLFSTIGFVNIRNAIPSLHATWTILCFLALRHSPSWHKLLGAAYVLVTFITTLGLGLHYLVDWVAALPLVLLVRGLTAALPLRGARGMAIAAGAGLLALWVITVRGAPLSLEFPFFIRVLVAGSIVVPLWLEWRLSRAARMHVTEQQPSSAGPAYGRDEVLAQ